MKVSRNWGTILKPFPMDYVNQTFEAFAGGFHMSNIPSDCSKFL